MSLHSKSADLDHSADFPFRLFSGELPEVVAFDLDDTLITGDSMLLWHEWLNETGVVPERRWLDVIARMLREYHEGRLDMAASLAELMPAVERFSLEELSVLLERFIDERIVPRIRKEGRALIAAAQAAGRPVVIISASSAYIVRPIARRFGIENVADVIGIEMKTLNGHLTGEVEGVMSFREGKVVRLSEWLAEHRPGVQLAQVFFFTDSANDLPLSLAAGGAAFVNPDPVLEAAAHERRAPVLFWHSPYDEAERAKTDEAACGQTPNETLDALEALDDPDNADDRPDPRAGRFTKFRHPGLVREDDEDDDD